MKKALFFLSVLSLFLISCSNNDSESIDNTGDNTTVDNNTGLTDLLPINTSVLLKQKIVDYTNGEHETYDYVYDGKKIKKLTYTTENGVNAWGAKDVGLFEYTYTGNLITKIIFTLNKGIRNKEEYLFTYDKDEKLVTYTEYDLVNNWLLTTEHYTHNSDGSIEVKRIFGSHDNEDTNTYFSIEFKDGEVSEIIGKDIKQSNHTYIYEKSNNPLRNVIGLDKISFVGGKAEDVNYNKISDWSSPLYLFNYKYTKYNSDNYPTESSLEERVKSDGNTYKATIQYFYY